MTKKKAKPQPKPALPDLIASVMRVLNGEYPWVIKIEITAMPIQPVVQGAPTQEIQK